MRKRHWFLLTCALLGMTLFSASGCTESAKPLPTAASQDQPVDDLMDETEVPAP